jgi:hypothetical protein
MQTSSKAEKESPQLIVLSDDEVRQAITSREAIKVVSEAFVQLHTKEAQVCLLFCLHTQLSSRVRLNI